ncbi:MAG: hypothetical protein Q9227_003833 [Pyrenula ochraceoflavens]
MTRMTACVLLVSALWLTAAHGSPVIRQTFARSSPTYQDFPSPQHLTIPFQVPQREPGTASVTVQPDNDPVRNGLTLLSDLPVSQTKGFPLFNLSISSPSVGWRAYYGEIQIYANDAGASGLPQNLSLAPWTMDSHPIFEHVDTPFYDFATNPTFFDAPYNHTERNDWVARAILCYVPDVVVTRQVKPILAVEWGYWIDNYQPHVKEAKQLDIRETWNEHLDLLRGSFPDWIFDAS